MKKIIRLYEDGAAYDFQRQIDAGKCMCFTEDEDGVHWCQNDTAQRELQIAVNVEDVRDGCPHVITLFCLHHLSASNRLRAHTTEWFLLDRERDGQTEIILWRTGGPRARRWAYCFNHHERDRSGKMIEWNTEYYDDFITRSRALEHAYLTYTVYGRDTPKKCFSVEELEEYLKGTYGLHHSREAAFAGVYIRA